ncbi:MAG: DEAD/DEAH box helicase [Bacillota bacterium]
MKYYLYLAWQGQDYRINYTHHPSLDLFYLQAEGYQGFELLGPPAPPAVAYYLWKQVGGSGACIKPGADSGAEPAAGFGAGWRGWLKLLRAAGREQSPAGIAAEKRAAVEKLLRRMGLVGAETAGDAAVPAGCGSRYVLPAGYDGRPGHGCADRLVLPPAPELDKIMQLTAGRLLFAEEIAGAALEQDIKLTYPLADMLQILAMQNRVKVMPAVEIIRPGEWRCRRCGQQQAVRTAPCPVCGLDWCPYCEGCVNMGEARGCRPVYAATGAVAQAPTATAASGRFLTPAPGDFRLQFDLTPPQEAAARQLQEFIVADPRPEALIWAVCGAGKTEVTFPAIRSVLNRGGRVLLAIPRRDVVLELAPRIREAFPLARVTVLYGGCEQKFGAADITVATTHQCLRFNELFDLVILDEADAYPYRDSAMLRLAVERAVKPGGKKVMMTATPDARLYADARRGKKGLITIPARFHGFPLPEPRIIRDRVFKKGGPEGINPFITDWLLDKRRRASGQVFIFAPTVKLCMETGAALQQAFSLLNPPGHPQVLQYSHAADPERDKKRLAFKQGGFPFFLSTTIMERGITVPNAHVMVLFADFARVFDEGALIQMAGRAGRSAAYPNGDVVFLGENVTPAMAGAVKKISLLNREAAAQGYIK